MYDSADNLRWLVDKILHSHELIPEKDKDKEPTNLQLSPDIAEVRIETRLKIIASEHKDVFIWNVKDSLLKTRSKRALTIFCLVTGAMLADAINYRRYSKWTPMIGLLTNETDARGGCWWTKWIELQLLLQADADQGERRRSVRAKRDKPGEP